MHARHSSKPAYKWNPEEYRASSSIQKIWGLELLDKLHLRGNETILDIGSGDGELTAQIASRVPEGRVVGIDNSAEMIELSRANFPAERYPNLSFMIKDATELDFDLEFDVIFSNATLHWILDHSPVIQGISRGLKAPGKVILQMGGKGNAAGVIHSLDAIIREPQWAQYFIGFQFPYKFYSPDEYTGLLKDAGLIPQRVELIYKDMAHPGADSFAAWIRTTWLPYTQRVHESIRERFVQEIAKRYVAGCPIDSDGYIHVDMLRLEVEAGK